MPEKADQLPLTVGRRKCV